MTTPPVPLAVDVSKSLHGLLLHWIAPRENDQQVVQVDADGGTFKLSFTTPDGGQQDGTPFAATVGASGVTRTTAAIAYNATAALVRTRLVTLANIDPGDVTTTGGPLDVENVVVEFTGQYAGIDIPALEIDLTGLSGVRDASIDADGVAFGRAQVPTISHYETQAWRGPPANDDLIREDRYVPGSRWPFALVMGSSIVGDDDIDIWLRVRSVSPEGDKSAYVYHDNGQSVPVSGVSPQRVFRNILIDVLASSDDLTAPLLITRENAGDGRGIELQDSIGNAVFTADTGSAGIWAQGGMFWGLHPASINARLYQPSAGVVQFCDDGGSGAINVEFGGGTDPNKRSQLNQTDTIWLAPRNSAPITPPAGYVKVYVRVVSGVSKLFAEDDAGTEHPLW